MRQRMVWALLMLVGCAHAKATSGAATGHGKTADGKTTRSGRATGSDGAPQTSGGAASLQAALVCPALGGPQWHELDGEHLQLRTNIPLPQARQYLSLMEYLYAFDEQLLGELVPTGPRPGLTDLTVFASTEQAGLTRPVRLARQRDERQLPQLAVVVNRDFTPDEWSMSARFVQRRLPQAPGWLARSLVFFLSAAHVEYDRVVLGVRIPATVLDVAREQPELLADWLVDAARGMPGSRADIAGYVFVHWMATGTEAQKQQLHAFFADLQRGADLATMFAHRFGEPSGLRDGIVAHARLLVDARFQGELVVKRPLVSQTKEPRIRTLDDAELHEIWWHITHSVEQTQLAAQHADGSPLTHLMLAQRARDDATMEGEMARAIALAPNEPHWRLRRTLLRVQHALDSSAPEAETRLTALADEVAATAREAGDDALLLNELAWYYAKREQPAAGLPLARRAVALRPEHVGFADTLALLLFESGQETAALVLEEEAVRSLPYGEEPSPLVVENLERFRDAADASPPSP